MMSLSTVKDSGRKLSPHSVVREGDTVEGDIMQSKQQKKGRLGFWVWNMRTLLQAGTLENLKEEIRRNKLDVMGVSEVRWEQNGELKSDEFTMFYSSGDAKGSHGVRAVLGSCVRDKLISGHYVDNRMIIMRIQGGKVDLVIAQIYMPHSGLADEEVEETYDKIEERVEKEKKGECVILMGDWNEVIAEGEDRRTVGRYGLGKGTREENPW